MEKTKRMKRRRNRQRQQQVQQHHQEHQEQEFHYDNKNETDHPIVNEQDDECHHDDDDDDDTDHPSYVPTHQCCPLNEMSGSGCSERNNGNNNNNIHHIDKDHQHRLSGGVGVGMVHDPLPTNQLRKLSIQQQQKQQQRGRIGTSTTGSSIDHTLSPQQYQQQKQQEQPQCIYHQPISLKGRTGDPFLVQYDVAVHEFQYGIQMSRMGQYNMGQESIVCAFLRNEYSIQHITTLPSALLSKEYDLASIHLLEHTLLLKLLNHPHPNVIVFLLMHLCAGCILGSTNYDETNHNNKNNNSSSNNNSSTDNDMKKNDGGGGGNSSDNHTTTMNNDQDASAAAAAATNWKRVSIAIKSGEKILDLLDQYEKLTTTTTTRNKPQQTITIDSSSFHDPQLLPGTTSSSTGTGTDAAPASPTGSRFTTKTITKDFLYHDTTVLESSQLLCRWRIHRHLSVLHSMVGNYLMAYTQLDTASEQVQIQIQQYQQQLLLSYQHQQPNGIDDNDNNNNNTNNNNNRSRTTETKSTIVSITEAATVSSSTSTTPVLTTTKSGTGRRIRHQHHHHGTEVIGGSMKQGEETKDHETSQQQQVCYMKIRLLRSYSIQIRHDLASLCLGCQWKTKAECYQIYYSVLHDAILFDSSSSSSVSSKQNHNNQKIITTTTINMNLDHMNHNNNIDNDNHDDKEERLFDTKCLPLTFAYLALMITQNPLLLLAATTTTTGGGGGGGGSSTSNSLLSISASSSSSITSPKKNQGSCPIVITHVNAFMFMEDSDRYQLKYEALHYPSPSTKNIIGSTTTTPGTSNSTSSSSINSQDPMSSMRLNDIHSIDRLKMKMEFLKLMGNPKLLQTWKALDLHHAKQYTMTNHSSTSITNNNINNNNNNLTENLLSLRNSMNTGDLSTIHVLQNSYTLQRQLECTYCHKKLRSVNETTNYTTTTKSNSNSTTSRIIDNGEGNDHHGTTSSSSSSCSKLSKCVQCKNVYYCSKECQKMDWSVHKNYCKHLCL